MSDIINNESPDEIHLDSDAEAAGEIHVPAVTVQRRAVFRALLWSEGVVAARMWKIPSFAVLRDKPRASTEMHVTLLDLSIQGLAFACQKMPAGETLGAGDRLRIVLVVKGHEVLLDGEVKYILHGELGFHRVGIGFRKLEATVEGRRHQSLLSSLVGELQREQIARLKAEQTAENHAEIA